MYTVCWTTLKKVPRIGNIIIDHESKFTYYADALATYDELTRVHNSGKESILKLRIETDSETNSTTS